MADYQLTATDAAVIRTADGACIPNDPANRDWVEYQKWLVDGGVPDPYVPPPVSEPQPDALTEALRANARLDKGIQAAVQASEQPPPAPSQGEVVDPTKEYVTWEEFAALQGQVYILHASVTAMLEGQIGIQPKTKRMA